MFTGSWRTSESNSPFSKPRTICSDASNPMNVTEPARPASCKRPQHPERGALVRAIDPVDLEVAVTHP